MAPSRTSLAGYAKIKNAVAPAVLDHFAAYALLNRNRPYYQEEARFNSLGRYADTFGELLLERLQPAIEAACGEALHACYSYLRIYLRDSALPRHLDRPACEISATLTIAGKGQDDWPLWVEHEGRAAPVSLPPGDLMVYQGAEVPHWRESFGGEYWIQLFLHYVKAQGEYAGLKYDGRTALAAVKTDAAVHTHRNDPCPCGSGLKYRNCHGRIA